MLTCAVLTFLVGVVAVAADELVVSGPGSDYTFRVSGWGWVNLLTATVLRYTPQLRRYPRTQQL
jgi:hypothetical protein